MNPTRLQIAYGYRPKILLLGNGINRAFDYGSWNDLITSLQTKALNKEEQSALKRVPYPLQPVILTEDHLGTRLKETGAKLAELRASEAEERLLLKAAALPVDAILTTNYTYELEKALNSAFQCKSRCTCKYRKIAHGEGGKDTIQQLYTYFELPEAQPTIWHIHGEAARPDTMVLGHYFYGKLLSKMQRHIPGLQARFHGNQKRQQSMYCHSWIDYFMLGDVYILGLGMDLSELDLWWLVNCKKRHFSDTQVVLYKPDLKTEERLLAEAYGVKIVTDGLQGDNYPAYYEEMCSRIRENL
jgi:hypothetical protein